MLKVIESFLENKNSENATKMYKYMKEQFCFLGIQSTKRKELENDFFKGLKRDEDINNVWVLQLWSYKEREFQYFALDYLIKKKKKLKKSDISLIHTLILTKSWWDTVDLLASHIIGELALMYPELIDEYIVPWASDENIWLRRTAILYQLKYKEKTNYLVLERILKENLLHKDFFIKKAIGWALREYSKTNKEWVREFIKNNTLSQLSIREGSKYL